MRKITVFLIFLFCSSPCFSDTASNTAKVYYDPVGGQEVYDVSGKRDFLKIKDEFKLSDSTVSVDLNEEEGYRIKNFKIEKYNKLDEQKIKEDSKRINDIVGRLKEKNKDLEDLKELAKTNPEIKQLLDEAQQDQSGLLLSALGASLVGLGAGGVALFKKK